MNVTNLTAMGFIGLDVDTTMRIPEAEGAVLAAAQAVVSVAVESGSQNCSLVPSKHASLPSWEVY